VTDPDLAEQVAYYRRRAGEYDATSYGDVEAARQRIARIVAEMGPAGRVLEIACGTGMWTPALAAHAATVTAIDTAPEVIEIARERVVDAHFEVADVFSWTPGTRFDVIFFSAWLSHVPRRRFDEFWRRVGDLLAEGGRVLFVDEPVEEQAKESYVEGRDEIVERRLNDGTTFRIVKNFLDPDDLTRRLDDLGWSCTIRRDDGEGWRWLYGEATRHGVAAATSSW
jgi:demethylmenaquinone methyltransferase/2-methoxy-6-polyprenyl-1,4-benzoquinol methylase